MKDLSNEIVIHKKVGNVEYLQFRKLLKFPEINHAYSIGIDCNFRTSTIKKESLEESKYRNAVKDYEKLCEALDSKYINTVKSNQTHSDNVKIVVNKINQDSPDFNLEEYKETDGLMTDKKNLILSTTNADCILMFFYDPVKKVIANVHSGWRGTLQKISIKTIEKMKTEFGVNPENVICAICPSIRKCHFEVDKDVKELFSKEFKTIEKEIEYVSKGEKWYFDTVEINKIMLKKAGLKEENILDSNICSCCNCDQIHSYRMEKEGYGLSTALIELR